MTEIIKAALSVLFVYAAFLPGNLLAPIANILWKAPWWIRKPTFECMTCMTSVYGTAYFLLFVNGGISEYVTFLLPMGGLLFLIEGIITLCINPEDCEEGKS